MATRNIPAPEEEPMEEDQGELELPQEAMGPQGSSAG